MKKILVLGAGRSSSHLVRYLLDHASAEQWIVRIGDADLTFAKSKIGSSPYAEAFQLNGGDGDQRRSEIAQADLVISMLPATMHIDVALDCLALGKHVITPSYVSPEMMALDEQVRSKGLLFLNEMGVDPGIDHMSAMKIIQQLRDDQSEIVSFESFTGGLIAPEFDTNPWNYKITWNPRNVVLAGYGGTARYLQDGGLKFIPYHRLFSRLTPVHIDGYGDFEGYANRDSLKYVSVYGLEGIPTLYRGTLRRAGYCKAWDALVQLGLTDDSFELSNPGKLTWRQLTRSFLSIQSGETEEKALHRFVADADVYAKLIWLGILDDTGLNIEKGSPAVALQKLLELKWQLSEGDKDMIVMWHRFLYRKDGELHELQSSLITLGEDPVYTAMSKTVGLPIGIAAKHILRGSWKLTGVRLPIDPEVYEPVLKELEEYGVSFSEKHVSLAVH